MPRSSHSATFLPNELYDGGPGRGDFTAISDMTTQRAAFSASPLASGRVLFVGGHSPRSCTKNGDGRLLRAFVRRHFERAFRIPHRSSGCPIIKGYVNLPYALGSSSRVATPSRFGRRPRSSPPFSRHETRLNRLPSRRDHKAPQLLRIRQARLMERRTSEPRLRRLSSPHLEKPGTELLAYPNDRGASGDAAATLAWPAVQAWWRFSILGMQNNKAA